MELFIFGLDEADKIRGNPDSPAKLCQWNGVKCNKCVREEQVVRFWWSWRNAEGTGTLSFAYLPWSMRDLSMTNNALSGTINLADLPEDIVSLNLANNQLTGSLDIDSLQAAMQNFCLSNNKFTGEISLITMPERISNFNLSGNQLSANPTKGHLSVVGWTSTPVLGEAKNLFKPLVVFLSWRRPY